MNAKLSNGDVFPGMTLSLTGAGSVELPSAPADGYQIVLFYRGSF
jgi:hypothetical protein